MLPPKRKTVDKKCEECVEERDESIESAIERMACI